MSASSAASPSSGASEPDCPVVPFSFELFPPRSEQAALAVRETVRNLAAEHPSYISVTYGANGSSRDSSIDLLRYILETTSVRPLAHLTCVGSSYAEAATIIREFLEAGVSSFLALRGDPPIGSSEDDVVLGDLGSASELVQLIHRVQAERMPYIEEDVPGLPRASRVKDGRRKLEVSVAAFPNGHPRSNAGFHDVDALLAKQVAGADFAITQLFFHADDYLGFVERARAAGVTMPIVPGIMPVTTPGRLRRIAELSGQDVPADLLASLESAPDDGERFRIGVAHASDLARAVIVGGAPSLHLYTFNQHPAALAVLRECGLVPAPSIKEFA